MAKTKIKVTMYEQRYGNAVMTEEEYQNKLNEWVEELDNDESSFEEWLNDEFSAYNVFGKHPTEIRDLYHKANIEYVEEELASEWEEIEKEIVVDLSKVKVITTNCCCPCCGRK
jgi:predicted urease superfamily metal-dependent hydrolase